MYMPNAWTVWTCSESCRTAVLFPIVEKEFKDFVQFLLARHALTLARQAATATTNAVWKAAAQDLANFNHDPEYLAVLRYGYDNGRPIYSVLQDWDPAPRLFQDWIRQVLVVRWDLLVFFLVRVLLYEH